MKIRNNVIILALTVLLALPLTSAVAAAQIPAERQLPLVVDRAELLGEEEESRLLDKLSRLSSSMKCEVAVVTVNSLEGKYPQAYADDFFDYNGYGYGENDDGVLLLLSMEHRDWAITTHGLALKKLSESDLDNIEEKMLPYLSAGQYSDAFNAFADACRAGIMPNYARMIIISLGLGVIVGFIGVSIMKRNLKSVAPRNEASDYVRKDSFRINNRNDIFLYRTVTKTARPKDTGSSSGGGGGGSHYSSSGRSHGGRSGKF